MNTFYFGQNIGPETISIEYKEFTLLSHFLTYTEDEIIHMIKSAIIPTNFNEIVMTSLVHYLKQYVIKYRDAFLHPSSEITHGKLHIGVDDKGRVHGIPYCSIFNAELLDKYIPELREWCTEVEISPVNTYNTYNTYNEHPRLSHYLKEQQKIKEMKTSREMRYERWKKEFDYYTRKLVDLYNDSESHRDFLDYVNKNAPEIYQMVKKGYKLEQQNYMVIREYLERKEGVYYWVCKWKDEKLAEIRQRKPKPVNLKIIQKSTKYGPKRIFCKVNEMIPYWIQKNKEMGLYLLTFHYKKDNTILDIKNEKIRTVIQKKIKGEMIDIPCCLPFKLISNC